MRKLIILLVLLSCTLQGHALSASEAVVGNFAERLNDWCLTKSFQSSERLERLCMGKISFRASDDLMEALVAQYGRIRSDSYMLDDYISCLKRAISEGTRIEIQNIKDRTREVDCSRKDLLFASAEVKATGKFNYVSKDIFIVNTKDNKICRVTKYEERTDKKGRKRIHIDLSDLEDRSSMGFALNYDKRFPVGASLVGSLSWFMFSVEFGANLDKDMYTTEKLDMRTIVDYTRETKSYDPKFYVTGTPHFFYKYFAIGCGVGFISLSYDHFTSNQQLTEADVQNYLDGNGTLRMSASKSGVSGDTKNKLMLRPIVRGFITFSSKCSLSLSLGYDCVPSLKKLNGINCGIGFQWDTSR